MVVCVMGLRPHQQQVGHVTRPWCVCVCPVKDGFRLYSTLHPPFSQVLGTPTREQIREMNPNYTEFKFPQIKAHPWTKVSEKVNNSFTTFIW